MTSYMAREGLSVEIKRQVLHEAGYKCSNPACRSILTLDIHHLDYVSKGGSNAVDNLIALCPTCHALHHKGNIPVTSLRTWKMLLLSLNEAFDRKAIDILLALDELGFLQLSGDGVLTCGSILASGLVSCFPQYNAVDGLLQASYRLTLNQKGRLFIDAWKRGDQKSIYGTRLKRHDRQRNGSTKKKE